MLYLYHGTTSVCAIKVRLTLEEKSLPWQGEILHLQRGDQFRPEYLKLNPNAVVPTLVHDGKAIIESTIIMEYLEDAFPERQLMPRDAFERSQVRLWMRRVDDLHGACGVVTTATAFRSYFMRQTPDGREPFLNKLTDAARREKMRPIMQDGLAAPEATGALRQYEAFIQAMAGALERSDYLVGGAFSLADIAAIPYLNRGEVLGIDGLWTGRHPRVAQWLERMRKRPTYERAVNAYWDEDARQRFDVPRAEIWRDAQKLLKIGQAA